MPRPAARHRPALDASAAMQSRAWLEGDVLGHAGFAPPRRVIGPPFRQIQPIGHRQACLVGRDREAHRGLAILLLAHLTTILPRHPHRMTAFLRIARVVDDPRLDRLLTRDRRQHSRAPAAESPRPTRAPAPPDAAETGAVPRCAPCGHGREQFDALAARRRDQSDAVVFEWWLCYRILAQ